MLTPYQFASNMPIWAIDIDGLEAGKATRKQVVRCFNWNGSGKIAPDGTEVVAHGGKKYIAGTHVLEEGDPDGVVIGYFSTNAGAISAG